jgi:probable HAF family extracellular repeat protein
MTDLGTLGGPYSSASGINNAGQVAGLTIKEDGEGDAFLWENGMMTGLGTSGCCGTAVDLNDEGIVAGYDVFRGKHSDQTRAFIWQHGAISFLPTFGEHSSEARGINSAGVVVGYIETGWTVHAALWRDGVLGILPDDSFALANAINADGQIVGGSGDRAALWIPE